MKTSLPSGPLLTFDALTKENIKDVDFCLRVMHFNCGSSRPPRSKSKSVFIIVRVNAV